MTFQAWIEDAALDLRTLRRRLSAWLAELGVPEPLRDDIVLATHEAAANALEHAGSMGAVLVRAEPCWGAVVVEVLDHGRWKECDWPRREERGRGLTMIRLLVSDVEILSASDGTTVRMRHEMPHDHARSGASTGIAV